MVIPDKFTVLGIGSYSFFALSACFIGFYVMVKSFRRNGCIYARLPLMTAVMGASLMAGGAFVGYAVEAAKAFPQHGLKAFFMIEQCGFVAYGGIIGILLSMKIFCSVTRTNSREVMDVLAFVIPLSHGIARLGCFFSGCCYGAEYAGPFCVRYESHDVTRFPWQPVEMTSDIMIALAVYRLFRSGRAEGKCIYAYLCSYAVCRFALEFLRGDEFRGIWGSLSTSQYISIAVLTAVSLKWLISAKGSAGLPSKKTAD